MEQDLYLKTPEELFIDFEADIKCGCHSLGTEIRRSKARGELQRRGRGFLREIVAYLLLKFPGENIHDNDENLFIAWMQLLCGIEKDHQLPEELYPRDFPFVKMRVSAWIECWKRHHLIPA